MVKRTVEDLGGGGYPIQVKINRSVNADVMLRGGASVKKDGATIEALYEFDQETNTLEIRPAVIVEPGELLLQLEPESFTDSNDLEGPLVLAMNREQS